MGVVQRVCARCVFVVETVVAGLVASNEKDGATALIERIKDPDRVPAALDA